MGANQMANQDDFSGQVIPTYFLTPVEELMGKGHELCLCMLVQGTRLVDEKAILYPQENFQFSYET
jgi:hypothetical protein